MHEMALARGIVDAVEEAAGPAGDRAFARVRKVVVEVGVLSCVDPHALAFCFGAVTKGTLAEDAALEVRTPPGTARCFGCDRDVVIERRGDGCPSCGSHRLIVTGGEELKVKELEVV